MNLQSMTCTVSLKVLLSHKWIKNMKHLAYSKHMPLLLHEHHSHLHKKTTQWAAGWPLNLAFSTAWSAFIGRSALFCLMIHVECTLFLFIASTAVIMLPNHESPPTQPPWGICAHSTRQVLQLYVVAAMRDQQIKAVSTWTRMKESSPKGKQQWEGGIGGFKPEWIEPEHMDEGK